MDIVENKMINLIRDMTPYVDIITQIVKYFRCEDSLYIFEIGVRRATSTKAILHGLQQRLGQKGHLYSCDIVDRQNVVQGELLQYWTFYHKNSQDLVWNLPIDILFVDGNHEYLFIKSDYEKYEPFVRLGGLILMHDMNPGASDGARFWEEIKYPKVLLNLNKEGLGIVTKI